MNPNECSFHYIYKNDEEDADDFCAGCDGFDKKCEIYTPLRETEIWKEFCAEDTKRIEKEDSQFCVLWKLPLASQTCKDCKGRNEHCLAHMTQEEFDEHKEAYEEIEKEFHANNMGKCD